MLVLSRREGSSVRIREDIEVSVVRVDGNRVTLGITAPSEVPIYRSELWEKMQREQRGEAA